MVCHVIFGPPKIRNPPDQILLDLESSTSVEGGPTIMDPPVEIFYNIWTGGSIYCEIFGPGVHFWGVRFYCDRPLYIRAFYLQLSMNGLGTFLAIRLFTWNFPLNGQNKDEQLQVESMSHWANLGGGGTPKFVKWFQVAIPAQKLSNGSNVNCHFRMLLSCNDNSCNNWLLCKSQNNGEDVFSFKLRKSKFLLRS